MTSNPSQIVPYQSLLHYASLIYQSLDREYNFSNLTDDNLFEPPPEYKSARRHPRFIELTVKCSEIRQRKTRTIYEETGLGEAGQKRKDICRVLVPDNEPGPKDQDLTQAISNGAALEDLSQLSRSSSASVTTNDDAQPDKCLVDRYDIISTQQTGAQVSHITVEYPHYLCKRCFVPLFKASAAKNAAGSLMVRTNDLFDDINHTYLRNIDCRQILRSNGVAYNIMDVACNACHFEHLPNYLGYKCLAWANGGAYGDLGGFEWDESVGSIFLDLSRVKLVYYQLGGTGGLGQPVNGENAEHRFMGNTCGGECSAHHGRIKDYTTQMSQQRNRENQRASVARSSLLSASAS